MGSVFLKKISFNYPSPFLFLDAIRHPLNILLLHLFSTCLFFIILYFLSCFLSSFFFTLQIIYFLYLYLFLLIYSKFFKYSMSTLHSFISFLKYSFFLNKMNLSFIIYLPLFHLISSTSNLSHIFLSLTSFLSYQLFFCFKEIPATETKREREKKKLIFCPNQPTNQPPKWTALPSL